MAKIGKEVEGRFRGLWTLFLTTDEVCKLKLPSCRDVLQDVSQVVVNDEQSQIRQDDIDILMTIDKRIVLTIVSSRFSIPVGSLPYRINVTYSIKDNTILDLSNTDQVKFVDNSGVTYIVTKETLGTTLADEYGNLKEVSL